MDFFISTAWAQAAPSPTGGMLGTVLPLLLIFVVFYFLLIRPQQKTANARRARCSPPSRRATAW